jgi:hypothetical protein
MNAGVGSRCRGGRSRSPRSVWRLASWGETRRRDLSSIFAPMLEIREAYGPLIARPVVAIGKVKPTSVQESVGRDLIADVFDLVICVVDKTHCEESGGDLPFGETVRERCCTRRIDGGKDRVSLVGGQASHKVVNSTLPRLHGAETEAVEARRIAEPRRRRIPRAHSRRTQHALTE